MRDSRPPAATLTDHRAVVLAVAAALVKRRTLSGTEIDGIIGTVRPSPICSELADNLVSSLKTVEYLSESIFAIGWIDPLQTRE
jgi:hypothetical protein